MRFFPPVVTGPIVISIGLILASSAIANCQTNWLVAVIAVAVIIICNIWGRGMVKIVPILLGVVVSYAVAAALGEVDFSGVAAAPGLACPSCGTTPCLRSLDRSSIAVLPRRPSSPSSLLAFGNYDRAYRRYLRPLALPANAITLPIPVCTVPCSAMAWRPSWHRFLAPPPIRRMARTPACLP